MSVFKDQFSKALPIWQSQYTVIPSPYVMCEGTDSVGDSFTLTDYTKDFAALGVSVGDIVYNKANQQYATIICINKNGHTFEVCLSANIMSADNNYIIYQQSAKSGLGNQGCNLYIGDGGSGAIQVETIGGDVVTFNGVKSGDILPVQVKRFLGGNVGKVIAFW